MRIHEKVEHKYEIETCVKIICDLCGLEVIGYCENGEWETCVDYEFNKTTIKHEYGEAYPETRFGSRFQADLCPKCFEEKLVPWLKSQGCKADYEDFHF